MTNQPADGRDADDAATDDVPAATDDGSVGADAWWRPTSDRLAWWAFLALVAAAGPLILFKYGDYHWFFRDDFQFFTERNANGWPPLLKPHGGAHLTMVPRLAYAVMWELFGMRSYLPYQACVVGLHLATALLIRAVMRRTGVTPWVASAVAAVFVLFGPGAQNIVWAFQIGFTGSLAYGIAQLLVADHDGPIGRRDALALGLGALAVASSGVGIATTVAVGVAVLLRRGWRAAALQTVPLGVLMGVWVLAYDAGAEEGAITPTLGAIVSWTYEAFVGVAVSISYADVVAVVVIVLAVAGLASMVHEAGTVSEALRRAALPLGLLAGSLVFTLMTAWGRAGIQDASQARASRYMHILAAMVLPILALGIQGIARRWPMAVPALVLLFVVPLPFNTRAFTPVAFGENYMRDRQRILTTAPRVEGADEVPRWVQPLPDPFMGEMTIGFLRDAARDGDLPEPSGSLGPMTEAEFDVRLGLGLRTGDDAPAPPTSCQDVTAPVDLDTDRGDVIGFSGAVRVAARLPDGTLGPWVDYQSNPFVTNVFTIEHDDLDLAVRSGSAAPIWLCTEP